MWEINVSNQLLTFLYSLLLGTVLCVIYDILRCIRLNVRHGYVAVFIEDILFWINSAFITFLFLLSRTNGEIRGYVIISEFAAFLVFRYTFSRFIMIPICFAVRLTASVIGTIAGAYTAFMVKTAEFCTVLSKKCGNFIKKLFNISKNS